MDKKLMELQTMDIGRVERGIWRGLKENSRDIGAQILRPEELLALVALAYWSEINDTSESLMEKISAKISDKDICEKMLALYDKFLNVIVFFAKASSKKELKGYITQFVGEPKYYGRKNSENYTPKGICDLATRILDIKKGDKVLDLCSGVNSFITNAYAKSDSADYLGVDINSDAYFISVIKNAVLDLNIKNILGNALTQDFSDFKANKVFSNFPFALQLRNEIRENSKLSLYFINSKQNASSDWVFSMAAFLNQVENGKTVTVMANNGLINIPDSGIRKYLVDNGLIEAVIALPGRLYKNMAIPVNILVMSKGNEKVNLIDATGIYVAGRWQNDLSQDNVEEIYKAYCGKSEHSIRLSTEELAKQDYVLNPARYIIRKDSEIKDAILFGDVCLEINRGAIIRAEVLDANVSKEKTPYQYLMLKNINNGVVDQELPYLKEITKAEERYTVTDGDIVLSKISPFKIAMVTVPKNKKIIANGNLYFIKVDKTKINAIFLTLYLQSELGLLELNRLAKGVAMQALSIRDLKEVRIPNIPLKEQEKIAGKYQDLQDELSVLEKQKTKIDNKITDLMQEVF